MLPLTRLTRFVASVDNGATVVICIENQCSSACLPFTIIGGFILFALLLLLLTALPLLLLHPESRLETAAQMMMNPHACK